MGHKRTGSSPFLSLIVARSNNNVIGVGNGLPWHSKKDLQWFKRHTFGKPIILGRKCWDSLPKKTLPGRPHFIVSRNLVVEHPKVTVCTNFDVAVEAAIAQVKYRLPSHQVTGGPENANDCSSSLCAEIMVIGGAQIYALALPMVRRLYLTEMDVEVDINKKSVTQLPDIDLKKGWEKLYEESFSEEEGDGPSGRFLIYERQP